MSNQRRTEKPPALSLRDLHVGYAGSEVLRGIDLDVEPATIAAVLGRNGAGKTTLVESVMGIVPHTRGHIDAFDARLARQPAWRRARAGLQLVRQGRHVFPSLTVAENLTVARREGGGSSTMEELFEHFPNLPERLNVRASRLSGGEQQMLAVARAVVAAPRVLLLDEPSEGLAPQLVTRLGQLIRLLCERGTTIVLTEQAVSFALALADRAHVLGAGRIVLSGTPDELRGQRDLLAEHLGA